MIIFKKNTKKIRDALPMIVGILLLFILFYISKTFGQSLFNFFGAGEGDFPNPGGAFFASIILIIFIVGGACLGGYIVGKLLPEEKDDSLKFNDITNVNTQPKKIYRYLTFISTFVKKIYKYIIVVTAFIVLILFVFPSFSITKLIITKFQTECLPDTTPWVKVISPNGGEVYNTGQKVVLRWKSCNISASEHITGQFDNVSSPDSWPFFVFGPPNSSDLVNDHSLNDGQEEITFFEFVSSARTPLVDPGTYKFTVHKFNDKTIVDSSDNFFTIKAPVNKN